MCGPCCPGKAEVRHVNVDGQSIGISGYNEIMERGLAHVDGSDEEQKSVLLDELKKRNYVPPTMERQYLSAIWAEFKILRAKKKGWVEDKFPGVPREDIPWFPVIDYEKCTSCQSCFEFCKRGIYTFDDSPKVTNPYRCVVGCTGCQTQCKEGAISFLSLVDLREELKALRKKYKIPEA